MSDSVHLKKRAGHPGLPDEEKRTERIELRATTAEKQRLELLCQQADVTMTTLLINGTLDGIGSLPQFQRLPPAIEQQLGVLQRVAGRLFSYTHHLDSDGPMQQQARQVVYALGQLERDFRQQLEQTALPTQLIRQLTALRCLLIDQPANPTPTSNHEALLSLINDIVAAYNPDTRP